MKKIFLLACLVVSAAIYSQELDEAYLQSLPESVREDVLNKIEAKDNLDKPVYRRASTFIDKKEEIGTDDHVEDWNTGKFVVDEQSMLYVAGTQIDWKEEVFGSQFEITNPNATAGCGCGESFGV